MSTKRGPRPRAGERASRRIEFRVTPREYEAIRKAATANQYTVSELARLGCLRNCVDFCDPDELPDIVMGGALQTGFAIVRRA
jgi:hypothetical protein